MADDIRLYMFQSGILKTYVQSIKPGQGMGEPYDIPVPWFLITHGHSPGHQSFEVTLLESGTMLLTLDAAYTTDHWNERALPGLLASAVDAVRSVKKLHRIAERSGATVVTGHDPDAWSQFKQAPEYYA